MLEYPYMKVRFSRLLTIFFLTFFAFSKAYALVELGGEYSYSKRVYGVDRESSMVSRSTGASLAIYLLNFMAVEFNYNKTTSDRQEFPNITTTGTNLVLTEFSNKVIAESWGSGIRFSLAPKKAVVRPDISIGYAKQAIIDSSLYTFVDSTDNSILKAPGTTTRFKSDSVFGSFAINLRLTQRLKLKFGVSTIFPAFEWEEAKNFLKYSVGFQWVL